MSQALEGPVGTDNPTDSTEPLDPPITRELWREHRSRKLGTSKHLDKIKNHYLSSSNPDDSLIDPSDSPTLCQLDGSLQLRKLSGSGREYIAHRIGERASDHGNTLHARAKRKYRRALDLDRHMRQEWSADLWTSMLTFRVSPEGSDGLREPLSLLDDLAEGISPALKELRRLLRREGIEYEYTKVITGTRYFATPHCHVLLYMDGRPPREVLAKVIDKYQDKCPAPTPGHDLPDSLPTSGKCVTHQSPEDRVYTLGRSESHEPASTGARYIARQLPHITPASELQASESLELHSRAQFGAVALASSRRLTYCSLAESEIESPESEPTTDTVGDRKDTHSPEKDQSSNNENLYSNDLLAHPNNALTSTENEFVEAYCAEVGIDNMQAIDQAVCENYQAIEDRYMVQTTIKATLATQTCG